MASGLGRRVRAEVEGVLLPVLEEAQALGFIGPGPLSSQIGHALGFAEAAPWPRPPGRSLDLGSGGGLPGLVLAVWWPTSRWVLVDAGQRRTAFLRRAVGTLGLADRVEVRTGRAEELGRDAGLRGGMALVTARGFGPPAVTVECAAPFAGVGGVIVVSDPPGGRQERWPEDGLARAGMARGPSVSTGEGTYQVLCQVAPCPTSLPRRTGVPGKRPLFTAG